MATTRPETILGDTAVAVNPEDDRFKHMIGKKCVVPFTADAYRSRVGDSWWSMEFGTALKITPGHDPNDYEIGKRVGLDIINIMNKDGTMNSNCGKYNGVDRGIAEHNCGRTWKPKAWPSKPNLTPIAYRDRKEAVKSSNPSCPSSGFARWTPWRSPAEGGGDGRAHYHPTTL